HADELALRPPPVADAGDVLVAEAIELGGAHHDVAAASPDEVEDKTVGQPALDGARNAEEASAAVAEQEVGRESRAGEASAQGGDEADGAGQDLAVSAPGLRAGDRAQLGEGVVAHGCTQRE